MFYYKNLFSGLYYKLLIWSLGKEAFVCLMSSQTGADPVSPRTTL